jgi:cytochrome b pre-mRNA-processing protein 3
MILGFSNQAKRRNAALVNNLYGEIVAAARKPAFYVSFGVPDTPLGRFEMLCLHMFLFLERGRTAADAAFSALVQDVVDTFFTEVDHSLRELGIGDLGVPKRMKKLARMFYGRCQSYGAAISAGDKAGLTVAFRRNVWPEISAELSEPGAAALTNYAFAAHALLEQNALSQLIEGKITFPDPDSTLPVTAVGA